MTRSLWIPGRIMKWPLRPKSKTHKNDNIFHHIGAHNNEHDNDMYVAVKLKFHKFKIDTRVFTALWWYLYDNAYFVISIHFCVSWLVGSRSSKNSINKQFDNVTIIYSERNDYAVSQSVSEDELPDLLHSVLWSSLRHRGGGCGGGYGGECGGGCRCCGGAGLRGLGRAQAIQHPSYRSELREHGAGCEVRCEGGCKGQGYGG